MESTGSPGSLVIALGILVAIAVAIIALWRGERARPQPSEGVTRARTRRAYRCFLAWGTFVIVFGALALLTAPLAFGERQAAVTLVGIFAGVPAAIALLVGLFHALMVWRVALIRLLLLVTVVLLPVVFTDLFREPWSSMIAVGYGLIVIGASVRGLLMLRTNAAS